MVGSMLPVQVGGVFVAFFPLTYAVCTSYVSSGKTITGGGQIVSRSFLKKFVKCEYRCGKVLLLMPEEESPVPGRKGTDPLIFVVFGIPGAGKTTIAKSVAQTSSVGDSLAILSLDLDDCIPQWMRDNFAVGMYPTLAQREDFAKTCCDYVDDSILRHAPFANTKRQQILVVSFSFVNQDLRVHFRQHFPSAHWILIDTTEEEAQRRMAQRTDHFYKGKTAVLLRDESQESIPTTNEWNFDTVTFPHTVLNGQSPIEENASKIVAMMQTAVDQSNAE